MTDLDLRPVASPSDLEVLAWLWQCFRHDLAGVVHGRPYADGRYSVVGLPTAVTDDVAAYLLHEPHPNGAVPAPVGFVVLADLDSPPVDVAAAWVSPVLRGSGTGAAMVTAALRLHPGPWTVAWQHENPEAGRFWRRLADGLMGPGAWHEERLAVPRPGAPDDHRLAPTRR